MIGFNVKAPRSIQSLASSSKVPIYADTVIYRIIEEVKNRLIDLLPKRYEQRVNGEAMIQQVFNITMKGKAVRPVAGCRVTNGTVTAKSKVRILRNKEVIYTGESLTCLTASCLFRVSRHPETSLLL